MLSAQLATIHNLRYYQRLMVDIRQAIEHHAFDEFVVQFTLAGVWQCHHLTHNYFMMS